jgi:mono/diheme cytochrome c family protein
MPSKGTVTAFGILALLGMAVLLNEPATSQENPKNEFQEEQRLIESLDGRLLFRAYCAACHGADGKGGGPAASSLKTPPPDLTLISRRNGGKFPAAKVQKIISGEDSAPAHGSRQMPVWGPIFGQIAWDQDLGNVRIYNLSKYIESLQQK